LCRWWDLHIERVIKGKFANPEFRAAHGKGRDYDDPTSYFASEGFHQLDAITGYKVGMNRDHATTYPTSMWLCGADALNLITWGSAKTTACGVLCEELPADMGSTNDAWGIFLVIEGPEEATDQRYCLERTISVMKKHAPMPTAGTHTKPSPI
jgi:hypothetical protein